MKKGRFICKLVLFTAVLALLLGLTAIAMADGCDVHGSMGYSYNVTKQPTCTETGSRDKYCVACGQKIGTEEISAIGHKWTTKEKVITAPTCTAEGTTEKETYCTTCGIHHPTEAVVTTHPSALGHDMPNDWTITKTATCTETGTRRKTCKRGCGHYVEETIAALGHQLGTAVTIKAPTCEGTGTSRQSCMRTGCNYYVDTTLDALGHQWGSPVTKAATCVSPATTTRNCLRGCGQKDVTTSGDVDLTNGHVWGAWKVTQKPNCTYEGVETRICQLNSSHVDTRPIPIVPDAHVYDNGTITKQPTVTEEGEKEYKCTLNPDHPKKIVKLDTELMKNNTLCAFGPRLRDTNLYPYNTDAWYMFTPFDASKEGTQTFELVASNTYIVGTVTLTIRDGNLKIDYTIADNTRFKVTEEFFTVLNRITDLTQYEPEQLTDLRMGKGETINLEEKFGDDTSLVLYFCSRCDFRYSKKFTFLQYESAAHQRQLNIMLDLMD
ncbi:MAG: hypothetical protein IJQ62_15100 [Clostridia bacterium]|nr:hypothetical protein [Clostridia bacterium]